MDVILEVLGERKCLDTHPPVLTLDRVIITVDQDGRYYYSGGAPNPYTVQVDWCHYKIVGEGQVDVQVARLLPPTWGFRFRPKTHVGYLPTAIFDGSGFMNGVEVALGADMLYWRSLNLGATVGFRGVSIGPGYDVTKNFGVWAGYEVTYLAPHHGAIAGIWFAF